MRLAKSLFKKCIRDIFRNIKQFISIIFIIAISCTLYIGLEANAEGFEKRVNRIFTNGNLSDIWVTINPNLNDFDNGSNESTSTPNASKDDEIIENPKTGSNIGYISTLIIILAVVSIISYIRIKKVSKFPESL